MSWHSTVYKWAVVHDICFSCHPEAFRRGRPSHSLNIHVSVSLNLLVSLFYRKGRKDAEVDRFTTRTVDSGQVSGTRALLARRGHALHFLGLHFLADDLV